MLTCLSLHVIKTPSSRVLLSPIKLRSFHDIRTNIVMIVLTDQLRFFLKSLTWNTVQYQPGRYNLSVELEWYCSQQITVIRALVSGWHDITKWQIFVKIVFLSISLCCIYIYGSIRCMGTILLTCRLVLPLFPFCFDRIVIQKENFLYCLTETIRSVS